MAKILFFTTALEHTTYRKTAKMLQKEGASVRLVGFTRKNYPVTEQDALSIRSLGQLSHGNYLRRIIRLFKTLPILRREAKKYDTIYNFTIDTFLISRIALLFQKKIWVYQVQDIRPIYFGNSLKNRFMRSVERKMMQRADKIVVSSERYYENHFKPRYGINENKVQIIENKLVEGSVIATSSPPISIKKNKLTVGYFGVLRCKRSWSILKETAIRGSDKFFLYLRGNPMALPHLKKEIEGIANISYDGPYKSPDELNDLYNRIDMVWAAYPYSEEEDGNWRYARTIRFYEAMAFGKPVIVQAGTPQEEDVRKQDIGLVVNMKDVSKTIETLLHISEQELMEWKKNIRNLPPSYYYHKNEYAQLLSQIESKIAE